MLGGHLRRTSAARYGTTITTHGAKPASFCETLPRNKADNRLWPRRPTTSGSRHASADRQENEIGAGALCQDCAGIDGAVRRSGAVGGDNNTVH